MSTDFEVVCMDCETRFHLGQRMANSYSFGYWSSDSGGRTIIGRLIYEHLGHDLRIFDVDDGPQHFQEIEI